MILCAAHAAVHSFIYGSFNEAVTSSAWYTVELQRGQWPSIRRDVEGRGNAQNSYRHIWSK